MNNLNFNTGEISLTINNDPDRVFRFNPSDIDIKNRFYDFYKDIKHGDKVKELLRRAGEADKAIGKDSDGLPEAIKPTREIMEEMNVYLREKIDYVFGAGSSVLLFGNINIASFAGGSMLVVNFIEAVLPYFEKETKLSVNKYTQKYNGGNGYGNRQQRRYNNKKHRS